MNKKPKITISIACYNKLEYTKQCLIALYKKTPSDLFSLIIINNDSTDGTTEWLVKDFNKEIPNKKNSIVVLNNSINVGFARAHNQAFAESKTPYTLFLNNDIIVKKDWLEPIIRDLDKYRNVAIVGSKLISPFLNGIQHAGVFFNGIMPYHFGTGLSGDRKEVNIKRYVPAVTGACFAVRNIHWRELRYTRENNQEYSGFSEAYLNGWEDIDACLRLRENGYDILYEPKSELFHYEGVSDNRYIAENQNRAIFIKNWYKKLQDGLNEIPFKEVK